MKLNLYQMDHERYWLTPEEIAKIEQLKVEFPQTWTQVVNEKMKRGLL